MQASVLLGLQWGDEGKGKVVDFLAPKFQIVARFQGGPNAGHTLVFDGKKHVLHQVPSGIFHSEITNIIGNGVVLDPVVFQREIDALLQRGLQPLHNLFISRKTNLIVPTHRLLDAAMEKYKGENKIGSTLRGIGPAYQDKYARQGLRVGDLLKADFNTRYKELKEKHLSTIEFLKGEISDLAQIEHAFFQSLELLKKFTITDTEFILDEAFKTGKSVLAEGAQGTLLDIDFGSYPFVTSSHTITAGACTGLGIAPGKIGPVIGIFKAYCTRVGSGPFPTELMDETGEAIRKAGNEFGSTTGRPRRCGWLDIPALKYAIMINGATELMMMKADVLNGFSELKICTAYQLEDGSITHQLDVDLCTQKVIPVYETLKGWNCSLAGISDSTNLPQDLKNYITYIEKAVGVKVTLVSTGPDRSETISMH